MTKSPHSCEDRPWEGRAILHVDLDAFFAAVEQLDHPEWRGRPVIVGGDPGSVAWCRHAATRRVCSACARRCRRHAPRSLCPNAIWTRGNFERYREISHAVRAIFADETPLVAAGFDRRGVPGRNPWAVHERASGASGSANPPARRASSASRAPSGSRRSKSVAKIASDHDKPDGLTVVCPGEEAEFLAPLPVRTMPGIGPRTAERLDRLGNPHPRATRRP